MVGQDGKGCFERLCIPTGTIQCIAKDDQDLHSGFDKFSVHAPQLGDMRAALNSIEHSVAIASMGSMCQIPYCVDIIIRYDSLLIHDSNLVE